jgi:hypothetical protein
MDIKGLDISQISKKMEIYLEEHFTGHTIESYTNGIFQEVIRMSYDEIAHLLIQPEGKQRFKGDEWFNGASGIVELSNTDSGKKESYTIMLVMDEQQTQALFLYVSKWGATTQAEVNTLIRDFTQGGGE